MQWSLKHLQIATPSHVRRDGNKLADQMANEGTRLTNGDLVLAYNNERNNGLLQECNHFAEPDRAVFLAKSNASAISDQIRQVC